MDTMVDWEAIDNSIAQAFDAGYKQGKADAMTWIAVSERLPEKKCEIYLCYTNTGFICECRWTNDRFGMGVSDVWDWNFLDVPQFTHITHWMPLPEPPKDGET